MIQMIYYYLAVLYVKYISCFHKQKKIKIDNDLLKKMSDI